MQIFLSPEIMKENMQILNIVDQQNTAVGYVSFLINDKKMYVYGHLEKEGVCEDYKDIIKPYILGMRKTIDDLEVYSYISVGGKKLTLDKDEGE
ncbi:hypothetical protein ACJ2A9_03405 [Anaerobacillus sp. MEB173]|uniref:hypothetical protein n=1 Tax=Anaerobacillus sp. MEB173 TaxID=3383345 RepID=UPI003F917D4B